MTGPSVTPKSAMAIRLSRVVEQLVERRLHVGKAQQISEHDHHDREHEPEHRKVQRPERLRYPAQRFEQRLAVAREEQPQRDEDDPITDEFGDQQREARASGSICR